MLVARYIAPSYLPPSYLPFSLCYLRLPQHSDVKLYIGRDSEPVRCGFLYTSFLSIAILGERVSLFSKPHFLPGFLKLQQVFLLLAGLGGFRFFPRDGGEH